MEKKVYEKPLMDVIGIDGDVITASGCTRDCSFDCPKYNLQMR